MKITSKPGIGDKVHIYLDEKYAFTLYDDFWYRLKIAEGSEISDDELAPLQEEAGFRSAYEKGLKYLSMRAYAKKELHRKLKIKFSEEAASRAVDKLEKMGYINDEEFADWYARYLFENKQYDVKRVSYELKMKGVDPETVSKTLKTLDNEPIQRIIVMLQSKFQNSLNSDKDKKRIINRLIRMGYSFHDIKAAFWECGADIPRDRLNASDT